MNAPAAPRRRDVLASVLAHRTPAAKLMALEAALRGGHITRDEFFELGEMPGELPVSPLAVVRGGDA